MPNHLTYMRFALGLGMIWLDLQGVSMVWIIIMGLIAGASDLLDGALARSRNLTSRMGAVLDPWATSCLR
jgi:phosphatidylglycerophosphate synthase